VVKTIKEIFRSYGVLNESGRHVNGTDKETNHHYGDAYETIIGDLRTRAKLVMEIGVAGGASLLAWRDVFENAVAVGFDIHHSDKAHGDRIEFHLGDMREFDDCLRVAQGRLFDFICEDATHRLEDSLRTLFYLWPFVKPDGIYVIEEFPTVRPIWIAQMWPFAEIVYTQKGRLGEGIEPLVVLRKP
jgi:hypothetical protein